MATQDTIKFGDIVLQIETTPGGGSFATVCGFTSIEKQYNVRSESEDLPDCTDPDAVLFEAPIKISVGEVVTFQGFVDATNSELLDDWVYAEDDLNIRLVYNKGAKVGYYGGTAIFTGGGEAYERRKSGRLSGGFQFTERPTWTAT